MSEINYLDRAEMRTTATQFINAYVENTRADNRVAATVRAIFEGNQHDLMIAQFGAAIWEAATPFGKEAKNNRMSAYRTTLRRIADESKLEQYPTVIEKAGSMYCEWRDYPADPLHKALGEAFNECKKTPTAQALAAFHIQFEAYQKALVDSLGVKQADYVATLEAQRDAIEAARTETSGYLTEARKLADAKPANTKAA